MGLTVALIVATLIRFGLLAAAAVTFFSNLIPSYPISTGLAHWHARVFLFHFFVIAIVAAYGFIISLEGRSPFRADLVAD